MTPQDSASRAVVVTGVSSGIGQALTARWGERFVPLVFDVTDAAALPAVVAQVQAVLGGRGLTALVNNAGISLSGPLMHQPLNEVRQVFEVNVFGLLAVTQAFLPLLGARSGSGHPPGPGRMVNIGSVAGAITVPFMGAYSGSKHAVEALTQALRHAIESAKPRTRYPLDASWTLGRILPDRLFDKLIFKALGMDRRVHDKSFVQQPG